MSYMVLECHSSYAVLLDEKGRFLKAANLGYEVGQTICNPVLMREAPSKVLRLKRWIMSSTAAAAACFLLLLGIGYYQSYMLPYSSIYLSINPQVQMDLNKKGTVLALSGINEDGEKLLENYNGKGKDKVLVADELIDRAIEMGYLSEGGQVSFSIDTPEEALFTEYGTQLHSGVTEHLDGRITITVEITHPAGNPSPKEQTEAPPPIIIPVYDDGSSAYDPQSQEEDNAEEQDDTENDQDDEEEDSGYDDPDDEEED